MIEAIINEEVLEEVVQKLDGFVWVDSEKEQGDVLRQTFRQTYDRQRVDKLTKEDYFLGLGKKHGCLAYDLEWGTRLLGSIKGGSKYKYGYETDFLKIKQLLQKVVNIDSTVIRVVDGALPAPLREITNLSKEINGFKTGRTVVPKLLSIYYSTIFLPIFNDQDHFLSKLLISGLATENTGLELYLEYNYKLLYVKRKLEEIIGKPLDNFDFSRLLYHTFPKEHDALLLNEQLPKSDTPQEEQKFEALEVQHYQTLLHRNRLQLFPQFKYFDEEEQVRKNGQYDTQAVGIMDMLCIDEAGNFTVIEIKRQATDKTIGQILRYMGWVQEELCKDSRKVSGLIVAERKDIQLEFALKVIPTVKFMKLGLTITLAEQ